MSILFHGIGVWKTHRTVRVLRVAAIRAQEVSATVVEGELSHARAEGDDVSRVSRQVFVRIVENRSTQGRARVVLASSEGSIERILPRLVSERGERAPAPTRRAITEKREQRGQSRPSRRTQRSSHMGGTRGASSRNDERFTQALTRGFVFIPSGEFVRQASIITLTEHRVFDGVNAHASIDRSIIRSTGVSTPPSSSSSL